MRHTDSRSRTTVKATNAVVATPDLPRNLATDKLLKGKPSTILQGATATCLACGRLGLESKRRRDDAILCLVAIASLAIPSGHYYAW